MEANKLTLNIKNSNYVIFCPRQNSEINALFKLHVWYMCIGLLLRKTLERLLVLQKRVMRLILFRKTRKHAIPLFLESQLQCNAIFL